MTLQILSLISLGLGLLAYLCLTIFCVVTWARGITGRAAFGAAAVSLLFILSLTLTGIGPVSLSLETLSLLCWMVLLLRVIGVGFGNARDANLRPVVAVFGAALGLSVLAVGYTWALVLARTTGGSLPVQWLFAGLLLLAICGLVLLEQVVRNTRDDYRWRLRYLSIGIGTLFGFELVHNALGLMFGAYLPPLLVVKPAVFALAAPFIVVASMRNPTNPLGVNLSRQFVFRSGILIASGSALLLLGFLGYLVQALEGDWGTAVLALVAVAVFAGVATVSGSSTVRVRIRRVFEEHVFAHKYDYREEWRRVTAELTEPSPDYDLAQQVLRALGRVLKSPGGAVWRLSDRGVLIPLGTLHTRWNMPLSPHTSHQLATFFAEREWVLDLEALPASAHFIGDHARDLSSLPSIRYVIPLMTESRLFGVAALTTPLAPQTLGWEDYDLIKLIARQASGFIALREAERELAATDKLQSFHQVSAFVVHDIKTIVSQLALLTQNAGRHKTSPAFVDDMVATVANAVGRMQKLLTQLKEREAHEGEVIDLAATLAEAVRPFQRQWPVPELHLPEKRVKITADPSKLRSAVGHLIQNAVDAANMEIEGSRSPSVTVSLSEQAPWVEVTVEDSGPGMNPEFIESTLFQPFSSTKGVAGMGIGAYQARAYVRSLGGDVSVDSRPGEGSRFTIRLPLEAHD